MSDFIDQFFGDAKKLTLTDTERARAFASVKVHAKANPMSEFTAPDTVVLSASEKDDIFGNLLLHMRRNPIERKSSVFTGVSSYFSLHRMTAGVLSVAILFSAGGGVTYAAEDAMPNDILYPVKVHFNEPIIEAMQRSPEQKLQWDARVIERRLREAEHIAQDDDLLSRHEEALRERIEERMEHLGVYLESAEEEQKEELAERIDAELERHQQFLEALENGEVGPPPHVQHYREKMGAVHSRFKDKFRGPPSGRELNQQQVRPVVPRAFSGSELSPPPSGVVPGENLNRNPDRRLPSTLQLPAEGWLSGRKRTTRNRVDEQSSRGFESPSLRQAEDLTEQGESGLKEERELNIFPPKKDAGRPQNDRNDKNNGRMPPPLLRSQHPFFQQGASDVRLP